jgi:hypothetical protein
MTMPNFLIIGAEKAGTSSLHYYLGQHPQIFMCPVKEPRFFFPEFYTTYCKGPRKGDRNSAITLQAYKDLFVNVSSEIAIGESSPQYLYAPKAPEKIKYYIPEVKMIVILRNPVERAFSAFCYQVRDGYENLSFEQALQEEPNRIRYQWRPIWYYQKLGFYHSQLSRYFKLFAKDQIRIYLYEDFDTNSNLIVSDIFKFLEVDYDFCPTLTRKNVSYIPKSRSIYSLFNKDNPIKSAFKPLLSSKFRKQLKIYLEKFNHEPKPSLLPETRKKLNMLFRQDILQLQDLIRIDLSRWLID